MRDQLLEFIRARSETVTLGDIELTVRELATAADVMAFKDGALVFAQPGFRKAAEARPAAPRPRTTVPCR